MNTRASTDRSGRLAMANDRGPRVAGLAVGFTILYLGLGYVFREFAPDRGFSPLFPPAGIMFGLFVVGGWRWLPLALGVRVVNDVWVFGSTEAIGRLVLTASLIALPYALCAEILRRQRLSRAHPREFAWFAAVGVGAAPTLAAIGMAVRRSVVDGVAVIDAFTELRAFWVGDALAIATITPLTLVGLHAIRHGRPKAKVPLAIAQRTEYALMVLAVAGAPVASSLFVSRGGPPAVVVLATLPLLWVSLRQDLVQAAIGTVVAVVLVSVTLRRNLPFDELIEVQYLLLCGTVAAAFAATVRRAHEDITSSLRIAQDRFRQIGRHAPIHFTEMAVDGRLRDRPPDDPAFAGGESIDVGILERWARFGPDLVERHAVQEFSWTTSSPDERHLDSLAMPVVAPTGTLDHVLVVTSDRTILHRASEAAERASTHDTETGLVNRRWFRRLIAEHLEVENGSHGVMVVSFHQAVELVEGAVDDVLPLDTTTEVASLIVEAVEPSGTVARIGDHQFGVAVLDPGPAGGGVAVLRDLADRTLATLASSDEVAPLPVSVGIFGGRATPHQMIGRAERAARAAGELGGDRVLVYHPALHDSRRRKWASVHELRLACERSEFDVYYQPIVQMSDRAPIGAEGLLRWHHPSKGLIHPGAFIPDAERSGLIVRIDDIVMDVVGRQLTDWMDAGRLPDGFTVSVNISPVHLADPELANRLRALADVIDPCRIRIEITESAAMRDPEYTVDLLRTLRSIGYTIILDDFGTGYSSMAWLHRLPVQVLKIDRSFVSGLADDPDARRIVELMVSLADDLGLSTTAEGIETEHEARIVTELGCTHGQGYLFGRPVPPAEAIGLFGVAPAG